MNFGDRHGLGASVSYHPISQRFMRVGMNLIWTTVLLADGQLFSLEDLPPLPRPLYWLGSK